MFFTCIYIFYIYVYLYLSVYLPIYMRIYIYIICLLITWRLVFMPRGRACKALVFTSSPGSEPPKTDTTGASSTTSFERWTT